MKRRLLAFCFALGLALGVAIVTRVQWSPICAVFEPGTLEWWFFGCADNPPPKDPSA